MPDLHALMGEWIAGQLDGPRRPRRPFQPTTIYDRLRHVGLAAPAPVPLEEQRLAAVNEDMQRTLSDRVHRSLPAQFWREAKAGVADLGVMGIEGGMALGALPNVAGPTLDRNDERPRQWVDNLQRYAAQQREGIPLSTQLVGDLLTPGPEDVVHAALPLATSIRRMRFPAISNAVADAYKIPLSGLFRKGPKLKDPKSLPLPDRQQVYDRIQETLVALKHLERNAPAPWTPTERGVFDRSTSAPDYRRLAGTRTMPPASGEDNAVLQDLLDNPFTRQIQDRQALLGQAQGGDRFYNLDPVARAYPEGPFSFRDFVAAGSAGSQQRGIAQELSNASIMLYALRNGMSYQDARNLLQRQQSKGTAWMDSHGDLFDRYRADPLGLLQPVGMLGDAPSGPTASGGRKIPGYFRWKLGEGGQEARGTFDPQTSTWTPRPRGPTISSGTVADTHEQKSLFWPLGLERQFIGGTPTGREYEHLGDLYRQGANRLGMTTDQYQAGRWMGGGLLTGLRSNPQGDYIQHLEDTLYYTAQQRGIDPTPANLQRLWNEMAQGESLLFTNFSRGGGVTP